MEVLGQAQDSAVSKSKLFPCESAMIIVFRGLQSPHTHLVFCLLAWLNPRVNKHSKISQWKLEILKTFVQFDAELLPHLITCVLRRANSNHDRLLSVVAALEVTTINQTLACHTSLEPGSVHLLYQALFENKSTTTLHRLPNYKHVTSRLSLI